MLLDILYYYIDRRYMRKTTQNNNANNMSLKPLPLPPSPTPPSVVVSAPGKVLLAGGYLVLERPNVGLVLAANQRFYTSIQASSSARIVVQSPQFHEQWDYTLEKSGHILPCVQNQSYNTFVEKTLRVCFLYLQPSTANITIKIQADNDFYSLLPHLDSDHSVQAVQRLPKFLPCPLEKTTGKAIVNKTGLGSSAALVTSLVGALVEYYKPRPVKEAEEEEDDSRQWIIHNLAQICHCHAQGKVGSGFDVSAAIHGTHSYRRFPKCLLPDLLQQLDDDAHDHPSICGVLQKLVELEEWTGDMVTSLPIPPQLQLLLGDVCGGSESPGMAKSILKWKQSHIGGPHPHWDDLQVLNEKLLGLFTQLQSSDIDYEGLANLPASEWPEGPLLELHTTFGQVRLNLKQMGIAAGVPIEPDEQSTLCDATQALPGVVTALVPGAGGYDAIAVLYIDLPGVKERICLMWQADFSKICPLSVQISQKGLRVEETPP